MRNIAYILGVDPGNHYGISYCRIDMQGNVEVDFTCCYDLNRYQHCLSAHSLNPITKYQVIQYILQLLFIRFNISMCCIEEAYVNLRFPSAAQSVIENVAYSVFIINQKLNSQPLLIHNRTIKKSLLNGSHVTKEDIRKAILNQPRVNFTLKYNDPNNQNKNELTEHEYDSVACVFCLSQLLKIF